MRKVNALLLILALTAGTALAACPDDIGTWGSNPETNPDHPLLDGRVSEAWCGDGGPGQPGNTMNAESWDGAALGTEWRIWGMQIDADGAELVQDEVVDGNGFRRYETGYDGGEFWLAGSGSWTEGDVALYGSVYDFMVSTTIYYVDGEITGQVSDVTFNGDFADCPDGNACVIQFAIANATLTWRSGSEDPMPMDYPEFLCDATMGELFTTGDITIGINCAVAVEGTSFTEIKSMYE
jgi:hypothetical protein